jgi:hypothetical protein
MKRKGFYIKKGKELNTLYLNLFTPDFIEYLNSLPKVDQWVKLKIYEKKTDEKGYSYNMEQIIQKIDEKQ